MCSRADRGAEWLIFGSMIDGFEIGHHTADGDGWLTGTTVVLARDGAVGGVDVRGGGPGTRETDLLDPSNLVDRVHAILLTGGSAFGLDAATGVVRWLEERGFGFPAGPARVPIVPAAVLFDLGVGDPAVRPDAAAGLRACEAATDAPVAQGRVGAGAGATCGKYFGFDRAEASGLGSAAVTVGGAVVAALSVANPVGDIVDPDPADPDTGTLLAGVRGETGSYTERFARAAGVQTGGTNTTLVVVAADAPLTKAECKALAGSAHVGIARVTRPSHTVSDGDTAFCLSTGTGPRVPLALLSVAVQEIVAASIVSGVRASRGP